MHAPLIQGAKKLDQAALAQPVSERFHITSEGVRPKPYLRRKHEAYGGREEKSELAL